MIKEIKPFIVSLGIILSLVFGFKVYGAPAITYTVSQYPINDSAFDLGTSTKAWSGGTFDTLCLTGDTCRTTWPSSGSSFTWPFTKQNDNSQGTSTVMSFLGGFYTTASSTFATSATTTFLGSIDATNGGTNHLTIHGVRSDGSDGLHIHADNWTKVVDLGIGNSANATFYGGVNIQNGLTQLATLTATNATTSNLYVSGRASTTEIRANTAYFGGNVGIATTNPGARLELGSGQIFAANGTNAAPSYSFTNGTGSGIYASESTALSFAANGLRGMYFYSGAGTDVEFHISPNSTNGVFNLDNNAQLKFSDTGSVGDTNLYRGGANQLKTDDALEVIGNVNIGDATNSRSLNITHATTPEVSFQVSATEKNVLSRTSDYLGIYDNTGGAWHSVFKDNGNFGVGTTSPSYKLSVSGSGFFDGGTVRLASLVATSTLLAKEATTTNLNISANSLTFGSNYISATTSSSFRIASSTLDSSGASYNRATTTIHLANYPERRIIRNLSCVATSTGGVLIHVGDGTNFSTGYFFDNLRKQVSPAYTLDPFEDFTVLIGKASTTPHSITCTASMNKLSD